MKNALLLFAVAACSLNIGSIKAQTAPAQQWDQTFGGNTTDVLQGLQQTSDGGFIIGGYSQSGISGNKTAVGKGNYDYWAIKTDLNGNKSWEKVIGTVLSDELHTLQQTSDGGYIFGGHSNGSAGDKSQSSSGGHDYWFVKTDNTGNKLWDASFGGNQNDILKVIRQTTDGGYILGGHSLSTLSGNKSEASKGMLDFWIVKVAASGMKQWDRTIGSASEDEFGTLIQTADGGFILGGKSDGNIGADKTQNSKGGNDFWIVKLDANGNKIWDKTLGGPANETLSALIQTPDGGFVVGGASGSGVGGDKTQASKGDEDYWIVKVDAQGNKVWDKSFGGNGNDLLQALIKTPEGGFLLGGDSWSGISGDKTEPNRSAGAFALSDYWLVRLDGNGNKLWDKTLGGTFHDFCSALQITADGGYLIGGTSESGIGGDKSQPAQGGSDYWIVKLAPDVLGIKEKTADILKLYPNPTTGKVNLDLKNHLGGEIAVFNALGQCVLKKSISSNNHQPLQLDLSNSAKGIYTVQVITGKQSTIKKVVLE